MFTNTPFSVWELNDGLLAGLESIGWEFATQVQKETIPIALTGKDVIGQARTGSGKTAAFGIGCLARIDSNKEEAQVLIISPTR